MRFPTLIPGLVAATLLLVSCTKEEDIMPAPLGGGGGNECGTAGARLQATFDGAAWCANASLFAAYADILTVNGITTMGSTLTLELDSLSVGTHEMDTDQNRMLFTTTLGLAYTTTEAAPATLIITSHDPATQRIKGSFSGNLSPALGGAPKAISGSFDLFYVD